jgi:hypothetical protein
VIVPQPIIALQYDAIDAIIAAGQKILVSLVNPSVMEINTTRAVCSISTPGKPIPTFQSTGWPSAEKLNADS